MRYILSKIPKNIEQELQQITDNLYVQRFLYNRGIYSTQDYQKVYDIHNQFDPGQLFDVESAGKKLYKYLSNGSKIVIYGDYDADGIVATSIVWEFLYRFLKYDNVDIYIPSRFSEGYGLNDNALKNLKDRGAKLIITVDCGIRDVDLVNKWRKLGLDFIITDHHQIPDELVKAAVVHPMHPLQPYKNRVTSGAVVAWKFIQAFARNFDFSFRTDLIDYFIDRVALTLITDVMPVIGENRWIVKKGLEKLKSHPNLGIRKLTEVAYNKSFENIDISTYTLGFVIGPRINAAGRIGNPIDALRLICTRSPSKAEYFAHKLNNINKERQNITEQYILEALQKLHIIEDKIIVTYDPKWNDGIIGLVASRLTKKLSRPALVITNSEDGYLKGSARSINGLDITEFIGFLDSILEKYGGHSMAAGFSFKKNVTIDDVLLNIKDLINSRFKDLTFEENVKIDGIVSPSNFDYDIFKELKKYEPFGIANPKPRLILQGFIKDINISSNNKHIFFNIEDEEHVLRAVYWNAYNEFNKFKLGQNVIFSGNFVENKFNGTTYLEFWINQVIDRKGVVKNCSTDVANRAMSLADFCPHPSKQECNMP